VERYGAPREILEKGIFVAIKNQKDFNKVIFGKTNKPEIFPAANARNRKWTP
jgi:hypothetical protein